MLIRLMKNNLLFSVGIIICFLWIIVALLAPTITPYNHLEQNMESRFQSPTSDHLCGTDSLGRDVFSRILVGSRISLIAGVMTIALASLVGVIYGGIAGYIGGWVDEIMMRGAEMVMSFPAIILAMTIAAALGPNLYNTLLAMVVIWWPNYARVMRSMVIATKENEYVLAAKSLGMSHFRIFFNA